jgi:hypothetical protein
VASIRVANGVSVVLEKVDVTVDSFLSQALLCINAQAFQDPLSCTVVSEQTEKRIAFRGCIFRVRSDIEVKPCSVAQKDIATAPPGHDSTKQISGNLVRA